MIVGGQTWSLIANTENIASIAPAAPRRWPVMDFVELKKAVAERVLSSLDHSYLNDVISQPTAENIATWIWKALEKDIDTDTRRLSEVEVWETRDCSAVIGRGDIP